jgi:hypothetical protein
MPPQAVTAEQTTTEPPTEDSTLADIEALIGSDHVMPPSAPTNDGTETEQTTAEAARLDVDRAHIMEPLSQPPMPNAALNSVPLTDEPLHTPAAQVDVPTTDTTSSPAAMNEGAAAPPPVPPPMTMPQFFDPSGKVDNPFLNPKQ